VIRTDSPRFAREKKTLEAMIGLYCEGNHGADTGVCEQCRPLLDYALARLERCPFGVDKPKCSQCRVHCYKPEMRERIQAVMRFAGPRMLKKHPAMAVRHVYDGLVHRPRGTGIDGRR
jgi:hypothetical protein